MITPSGMLPVCVPLADPRGPGNCAAATTMTSRRRSCRRTAALATCSVRPAGRGVRLLGGAVAEGWGAGCWPRSSQAATVQQLECSRRKRRRASRQSQWHSDSGSNLGGLTIDYSWQRTAAAVVGGRGLPCQQPAQPGLPRRSSGGGGTGSTHMEGLPHHKGGGIPRSPAAVHPAPAAAAVVDNLPKVGSDKLGKLSMILTKIFSSVGPIREGAPGASFFLHGFTFFLVSSCVTFFPFGGQ